MQWPILKRFGEPKLWTVTTARKLSQHETYGGFLKWCYPTTMCFPTKSDHFGVFWGYHHLRKHPYDNICVGYNSGRSTAALLYVRVFALMKLPLSQVESILNNNWQFNHYTAAVRERWGLFGQRVHLECIMFGTSICKSFNLCFMAQLIRQDSGRHQHCTGTSWFEHFHFCVHSSVKCMNINMTSYNHFWTSILYRVLARRVFTQEVFDPT